MFPDVDIFIAGGGLAGSTLATLLAQAGRDVLLAEREDFPRDKLCGEFLSPESQAILRKLDVLATVEAFGPARIDRARFVGTSGRVVPIRLPGAAYGISRKRLDATLFEAAGAAGAKTWTRAEVIDIAPHERGHRITVRRQGAVTEVVARTTVCAHGRRGRPDHALTRTFLSKRHPFVGLKRHHRPADSSEGRALAASLAGHVEIYPFDRGYCGMSFIETGEVNVCMLVHESVLKGAGPSWAAEFQRPRGDAHVERPRGGAHDEEPRGNAHDEGPRADAHDRAARDAHDDEGPRADAHDEGPRADALGRVLSEQHPALAARWTALEPTDPVPLAVAAVPFTRKTRYQDGVFFVGDAAGMIAPLAGDGQAMAMESACHLAALLQDAAAPRDQVGRAWERKWRQSYRTRMALAAGLQRLLLTPTTAQGLIWGVGLVPGLPDWLGRMTRS